MTDWNVGDICFARWVEDLEAVVAAADARQPFALLGISQGAAPCLIYAAKYPEPGRADHSPSSGSRLCPMVASPTG
jgi:pimeloyl-ACP methyl ester carboxylesterase